MLSALGACSAPVADPVLKDPAQWPLAKLKRLPDDGEPPEGADRVLARIKVGSHKLTAWIHPSGQCGLAGSSKNMEADWSMSSDMTRSSRDLMREEGFSGPLEPATTVSTESTFILVCTPTRMLITVKGQTSKPSVEGNASAQIYGGGLNAVVGPPEVRKESLPGATVTSGG
ncbi:hypothetical protein [Streptosporangium sp. NPDC049376]|uniref:hypothetical protein n=1 Tax=Streptosporangium sp. NPDC049376 TaxID=3366192 RepID=UPI003789EBAF